MKSLLESKYELVPIGVYSTQGNPLTRLSTTQFGSGEASKPLKKWGLSEELHVSYLNGSHQA